MGVDLRLLPVSFVLTPGNTPRAHCSTMLELDRRRELWDAIVRLGLEHEWPGEVICYCAALHNGQTGYGVCKKTPYGDPLKFLLAGELVLLTHYDAVQNFTLNRAAWSYLNVLDPNTMVFLYWH